MNIGGTDCNRAIVPVKTCHKELNTTKNEIQSYKLMLGTKASQQDLEARAIPDGMSPKRYIPMDVDSPHKRACTRMQSLSSSPTLRPRPEPKKRASEPKNKPGGLNRLAAKFNWNGEESTKQPLITSMLKKRGNDNEER